MLLKLDHAPYFQLQMGRLEYDLLGQSQGCKIYSLLKQPPHFLSLLIAFATFKKYREGKIYFHEFLSFEINEHIFMSDFDNKGDKNYV